MAKQGMKRPERTHTKQRNEVCPVPEIGGKAKSGKKKARPIIEGTGDFASKVYHTKPYSVFDSDLSEDNLENDLPTAERQDV